MMTDEISEFLEKIDSEHFNCVYSCNGMTLMRTEEYSNRLKQIEELKEERNKYKDHEDAFKNNNVEINTTKIITPCNFGVGTDEACCMVGRISSKPTKDINKDWNNFLLEIIEATVSQEPHLGDNLKQQCLDYLKEIKEREKKEGRL